MTEKINFNPRYDFVKDDNEAPKEMKNKKCQANIGLSEYRKNNIFGKGQDGKIKVKELKIGEIKKE